MPLSKTDPNGLTTRWELDDQGRTTREIHPDGTRVVTAYCLIAGRMNPAGDTSSNSPTCASPAAAEIPADALEFTHVEPRDASGSDGVKNGAFTRKYLDRAGRVLRQVTEAFDGSTQPGGANRLIVTDTEYGDLGQVVLQTQPYFLDSGSSMSSSTSTGSGDVGLTHMNGRMYDPTIGRFLSVDQLVSDPSDLQTYNRYSYVRNDPLARTDPSGWADKKEDKTWDPRSICRPKCLPTGENPLGHPNPTPNETVNTTATKTSPDNQRQGAAVAKGADDGGAIGRASAELRQWRGEAGNLEPNGGFPTPNELVETWAAETLQKGVESGKVAPWFAAAMASGLWSGNRPDDSQSGVLAPGPSTGGGGAAKGTRWKLGPNDLDFRGSGKSVGDALNTAFEKTGLPKSEFEVTRWARDANGKSFPVEWRHKSGAEVNVDWAHAKNGPDVPHVGFQSGGKRGDGGAVRGHILLDEVPFNR